MKPLTRYRKLTLLLRVQWAVMALLALAAFTATEPLVVDRATRAPTGDVSLSSSHWTGTLAAARLPADPVDGKSINPANLGATTPGTGAFTSLSTATVSAASFTSPSAMAFKAGGTPNASVLGQAYGAVFYNAAIVANATGEGLYFGTDLGRAEVGAYNYGSGAFQNLILGRPGTSTRVGIKNASPVVELDVAGSGSFSGDLSLAGNVTANSYLSWDGGQIYSDGTGNLILASGGLYLQTGGLTCNGDSDLEGNVHSGGSITMDGNLSVAFGTFHVTGGGAFYSNRGLGVWGVNPPNARPAAPTDQAGIIAVLRAYGLCQ